MARKYKKNNTGLCILCIVLALILIAACTLGGLQLWGADNMKPSNWGKKEADLAPVSISLEDNDAPFGVARTFENGARAYPLATTSLIEGYPSTKRATATCTLPEGGSPDRYEWEITGGEGLSVNTVNSDGSVADVTAQKYFSDTATLTARAYRGSELRGEGSITLRALPSGIYLTLFTMTDPDKLNTQYSQDISVFKTEIFTPANFYLRSTFLRTIQADRNDTAINQKFQEIFQSKTDIVVFFDQHGLITNTVDFHPLKENDIPFIVINDADTFHTKDLKAMVKSCGGYYFTAEQPDPTQTRSILDDAKQYTNEIAIKYEEDLQLPFDTLIDGLFASPSNIQDIKQDDLYDASGQATAEIINQYINQYKDNTDIVFCLPNPQLIPIFYLSAAQAKLTQKVWIIGGYCLYNYNNERYSTDKNTIAANFKTSYRALLNLKSKVILLQQRLNTNGILSALRSIIFAGGTDEYPAYYYETILI